MTCRRTEVRSPQTNGLCERFHRTVKEEFFTVAFRQTLYLSVDQPQAGLDRYLNVYNRERCHHGYRTKGRTPYQAFRGGLRFEHRSGDRRLSYHQPAGIAPPVFDSSAKYTSLAPYR